MEIKMGQIIITVADGRRNLQYDLEVPTDLEIGKLLDDIIQTLIWYEPDLTYSFHDAVLYSPAKKKILDLNSTLKREFIHNGDYLVLSPKRDLR